MSKSEVRFYQEQDGCVAVVTRKRGAYWRFREMPVEEYWRRTTLYWGINEPREYRDWPLRKGPIKKQIYGPMGPLPQ